MWEARRLLAALGLALSAGYGYGSEVAECVHKCIHTPAAQGHWECCDDPLKSSFEKPSCATGCLMSTYAHTGAECDQMCESAAAAGAKSGAGCDFQIPHGGPTVQMCGACNCGLRDCPWHPKPEPESCKDPSNGGPDGGDCGWVNRCRGSLEGCKKGCRFQRELEADSNRRGWVIVTMLLLCFTAYISVGVVYGVQHRGQPRSLQAHPHYMSWMELRGLVHDGVRFTQSLATGRARPASATRTRQMEGSTKGAKSSKNGRKDRMQNSSGSGAASAASGSSKKSKGSKSSKGSKATRHTKSKVPQGGSNAIETPLVESMSTENLGREKTEMTDAFGRLLHR